MKLIVSVWPEPSWTEKYMKLCLRLIYILTEYDRARRASCGVNSVSH